MNFGLVVLVLTIPLSLSHTETDDLTYKVSLPTAPRASRGPDVDLTRVPKDPPYTAFMGNLPFDVDESEIERFFHGLKVSLQVDQEEQRVKASRIRRAKT